MFFNQKPQKLRISTNKTVPSRGAARPQPWDVFFKTLAQMGYKMPLPLKKQADIVLVFVGANTSMKLIKKQQAKGAKVVQRVDGIGGWKTGDFVNDINNQPILNVYPIADAIVYQSEFNRKIFEHFFPPPKSSAKKYVILNGANTEIFKPEGPCSKIPSFKHIIITSAIWHRHPWKGLDTSIKVFQYLNREDTVLLVIGEVQKEEQVNDPRIIYLGQLTHQDMASYYRGADLFIFFPWFDWCPNAVVEALACGLPVVCSSCGGTAELIGNSGIVIPSKPEKKIDNFYVLSEVDYLEAAEAINKVMENRADYVHDRPDLDARAVVEKYIRVFMDLVGGKN